MKTTLIVKMKEDCSSDFDILRFDNDTYYFDAKENILRIDRKATETIMSIRDTWIPLTSIQYIKWEHQPE